MHTAHTQYAGVVLEMRGGEVGGDGGVNGTSVLVELVLRHTVQTGCCTSITCTTLAFGVRLLCAAVTSGHARGYMISSLTQTRKKRPLCCARE